MSDARRHHQPSDQRHDGRVGEHRVGDVVAIPLTRGLFALVDECDAGTASRYTWRAAVDRKDRARVYAIAQCRVDGQRRGVCMHRLLLGAPVGVEVDHINGNSLDNRRSNLRLATRSQNAANSKVRAANRVGLKGVISVRARYRARIQARAISGKTMIDLGRFVDAASAARAYDAAATLLFGGFARLNFPGETIDDDLRQQVAARLSRYPVSKVSVTAHAERMEAQDCVR